MERGFKQLENGDVQLTMSGDDYDRFLLLMGSALYVAKEGRAALTRHQVLGFLDRVCIGSPNYKPYLSAAGADAHGLIEAV